MKEYQLEPKDLLKDVVHLNERGIFVISKLIEKHLRYTPSLEETDAANRKVKTFDIGKDFDWAQKIELILNSMKSSRSGCW